MRKTHRILYVAMLVIMAVACTDRSAQLEAALELAGDNRAELERVMTHYENESEVCDMAAWLIANMPGHSSVHGGGAELFADSVAARLLPTDRANELWDSLRSALGDGKKLRDIETLDAEFLIDNIDHAYRTWKHSLWHEEVSTESFRRYVLPYRVADEMLRIGWRDSLSRLFAPLLSDVSTAKEAFEIIRRAIHSTPRTDKFEFPYTLDPVALSNHFSNVCLERCVYLAAACRSVGLPVVIDNSGKWANYSNNTHTWVALVLDDGTYTIVDDDSVARKNNIIDASTFKLLQPMPESYPYSSDFRKRVVKVWRQTYDLNPIDHMPKFCGMWSDRLSSPRLIDISADYGLTDCVEIRPTVDVSDVWLCSHALTVGWIPQAHVVTKCGIARFEHIADSTLLLPMGISGGKEIAVGNPFYISKGRSIEIIPDYTRMISATFTRKYPLVAKWHNRYCLMPTTRIEGSNNKNFIVHDTLFTITEVPTFYNSIEVSHPQIYGYIRAKTDLPQDVYMDCINVYDSDGNLIASQNKRTINEAVEVDTSRSVGKIEFLPWSDGNFVVPGHDYELAYWDNTIWRTIGRQHSDGYSLTFDNIPSGALLILHDLTEGKEERPFTLSDGKQIWW